MLEPTTTAATERRRASASSRLVDATARTRAAVRRWWEGSALERGPGWLLAIPDVGASCEVLLADALFHDLEPRERAGLLRFVRSRQHPDGAWLDGRGRPDLSVTALAWWARAQAGDDLEARDMVQGLRAVLELGGAQRAALNVRLWLAMAGLVPWSWLPSIPSELWLLPEYAPLSPARISTWARAVLTPYHLLARAPARLQLFDASALLLRAKDGTPIPPRLTRDGLAGDLLQAFDRGIKLSRKFPRGPVRPLAVARARAWLDEARQEHGGWFGARPTLLSLLALRVSGAASDDPKLVRGLAYLRRARGLVGSPDEGCLAQGLTGPPLGLRARLAQACDADRTSWLVGAEIGEAGPWQLRANAPAGGWPPEDGAQRHVDVFATCLVLDALRSAIDDADPRPMAWPSMRRAGEVLLAMQEPDGGFARFERGESRVPLARLPWRDADQLAAEGADDPARVRRSAMALRQLGELGRRAEDDRVRRGLDWLEDRLRRDARTLDVVTLAEIARCTAVVCPRGHALRRAIDERLRTRQHEDGSFGDPVGTAAAMTAMIELDGVCVQATRAARHLLEVVERSPDPVHLGSAEHPGLGLSPALVDPSAGAREVHLALRGFAAAGGEV
jgi:squalene cyclase